MFFFLINNFPKIENIYTWEPWLQLATTNLSISLKKNNSSYYQEIILYLTFWLIEWNDTFFSKKKKKRRGKKNTPLEVNLFDSICLRHGKTGESGWVWVRIGSIRLWVKRVILSRLKSGLGQSGCVLRRVDPYFSHEFLFLFFIFIKKTTCICHLKSYAPNYLM